jgi:hypothetical protein
MNATLNFIAQRYDIKDLNGNRALESCDGLELSQELVRGLMDAEQKKGKSTVCDGFL